MAKLANSVDFEAICRTCLRTENLNPIFINPEKAMRYSIAIYMVSGLKVEINDGLPQNMCVHCVSSLNNAIMYRKKCRDAETQLLRIKFETNPELNSNREEADVIIKNEPLESRLTIKSEEPDLSVDVKVEPVDLEIRYDRENDVSLKTLAEEPDERGTARKKTEEHMPVKVTSEKAKIFRVSCNVCQKELSIRSLDRHMQICHPSPGDDSKKVKCDLCDSRVTLEKMNRHLRQMHSAGNLQCRYCNTEFEDRQSVVDHVATCPAKKRTPNNNRSRELVQCDLCQKSMQRGSLRIHKAVKHKGLGPVCEHCGKKFGNRFRLNEHCRAKHGYEKFKCDSCEYQTASTLAMRNHERRHRGEKPYVCETCGASFHATYLLAQHKHTHRTERVYKCDRCPSTFKSSNGLTVHKQSLHSNRTYSCPVCARVFRWRHYAKRHLRMVHQYKGPSGWEDKANNPELL